MTTPAHAHPLPPEVLTPDAPLTEEQLDRLAEHVVAEAEDSDLSPTEVAARVADTMRNDSGPDGWRITGTGSAEWAMAHRVRIEHERAELAAQAEEWNRRIGAWFQQATRTLDARAAFFDHHLAAYAAEYRALDPRNHKTLTLPSGKVRSTEQQPKVVVTDDDALAVVLGEVLPAAVYDEVVKTTTKVLLTPLRKLVHPEAVVTEEGEVDPEGAQLPDRVELRAVYLGPDSTGEVVTRVLDPEVAEVDPGGIVYTVAPDVKG